LLNRFFAAVDREVDRFDAWLQRLGGGAFLIVVLIGYSAYCAFDCARFVLSSH